MTTWAKAKPIPSLGAVLLGSLLMTAPAVLRAESRTIQPDADCARCSAAASFPTVEDISGTRVFALTAAHRTATRRVSRIETCRALFDELGGRAASEVLSITRYTPARSPAEKAYCSRGLVAFTEVGSSHILLCDRFHGLPQRRKIAILIHEALHTAGMNEAPHDPDAPTSLEITRMVQKACSL